MCVCVCVCVCAQVKRPPEVSVLLVPQVSLGASSSLRPMAIRLMVKYPTDYPDRCALLLVRNS